MSIALCYDKAKDKLYIGHSTGINVLFESHEEKGYNHQSQFSIPETNFRIKIESNFKRGNKFILRALMWYHDIPLLNFHNWWNCLNFNLHHFEVKPTFENWDELFSKIIEVYKQKDSWNHNGINTGFHDLNDALSHPDKITICTKPWLTPKTDWQEPLNILLLARKTHTLLKELKSLKLENTQFNKNILNSVLTQLIPLIITTYKNLLLKQQDEETAGHGITTYINDFEEYFDTIYNYLKHTNQLHLFFTKL